MLQLVSSTKIGQNIPLRPQGALSPQSNVSLGNTDSFRSSKVTFGRYFPDKSNKVGIKQASRLIKKAPDIIFLTHRGHDGDAIGGTLGLYRKVKKLYPEKKVTFLMAEKVKDGFKFIDSKNEVVSLAKDEDISKYLGASLVVTVDVAERKMIHEDLLPILESAKRRIKIDHHPQNPNIKDADYYFGDVNVIDTSKNSASEVVMQFAEPLGLREKDSPIVKVAKFFGKTLPTIDSSISDPIFLGVSTDSGFFSYINSPQIFHDAGILAKTTDASNMRKTSLKERIEELETEKVIYPLMQFTEDKRIMYILLPPDIGKSSLPSKISGNLLTRALRVPGVDHSFYVREQKDGSATASIRSNLDISKVMPSIGGGGYPQAWGMKIDHIPGQNLTDIILKKLEGVRND